MTPASVFDIGSWCFWSWLQHCSSQFIRKEGVYIFLQIQSARPNRVLLETFSLNSWSIGTCLFVLCMHTFQQAHAFQHCCKSSQTPGQNSAMEVEGRAWAWCKSHLGKELDPQMPPASFVTLRKILTPLGQVIHKMNKLDSVSKAPSSSNCQWILSRKS